MKKFSWLLIFVCLQLLGCEDPNRPFPEVSSTNRSPVDSGYVLPDGSLRPTLEDASDNDVFVERIPETDNTYICYCRFEVPLNCVQPGCGTIFTGTGVTSDNFCDVGIREVNICIPQTTPPLPVEAIVADCEGRITTTLREATRIAFAYCRSEPPFLGPCDIRYGCTARRLNGGVRTFRTDRCTVDCGNIPLQRDPSGNLNLQQATYILAENQYQCSSPNYTTNHVCAWY